MHTPKEVTLMHEEQQPHNATRSDARYQRGQATTEYALILLVAAVIGLAVIAWATTGGGAGKIGGLFDAMIDLIVEQATSSF
jgi:Flp pilus assembly pilin Flp